MFETNDIALAAFLLLRGLALDSCGVEPTGRYFFNFKDPGEKAPDYAIEFLNSECSSFDNQMRNLRKILNRKMKRN
mgnify:FL=1|tara:strand:- start:184 stop:411 length:228 start_codon:yes stop_codon:yes gene_type:complete